MSYFFHCICYCFCEMQVTTIIRSLHSSTGIDQWSIAGNFIRWLREGDNVNAALASAVEVRCARLWSTIGPALSVSLQSGAVECVCASTFRSRAARLSFIKPLRWCNSSVHRILFGTHLGETSRGRDRTCAAIHEMRTVPARQSLHRTSRVL